ncbi:hypothetical protein LCGC14_1336920 [marine sediment metagenome]|uniref:Uncharacterized protein n=1 Tax=marine sediment metagenome TaxID=412755 RepID=A0A0F9KEQ8_9ZZZZ
MTRLEQILRSIPDHQLRLAVGAAMFFADANPSQFEIHAGTYGMESLKRLLTEEAPTP